MGLVSARRMVEGADGLAVVYGFGAAPVHPGDVLVHPFVHLEETFVVPASVGGFVVRCAGGRGATIMRAHVRGTEAGHGCGR